MSDETYDPIGILLRKAVFIAVFLSHAPYMGVAPEPRSEGEKEASLMVLDDIRKRTQVVTNTILDAVWPE